LEVLRHCFPSSVRQILEELPESLDETYECILREIRKPNQGHAHRLLQCLVAAVRPLEVKELAEVLAFDFNTEGIPKLNLGWRWEDQEEAVMSACSSLVMIVKNGDSRVAQFSHFSVKEFLTANRLAEPIRDVSRYHIRLEAAHTILVRACLGVLLELDDRIDRDSMKSFPLARYAAQFWATHARIENMSSRIKGGMECLFDADRPHFATWLWIYNEERWPRSMPTMHPEKSEAVPLYYAARLGFRDLAEHLIAEHPQHLTIRGGLEVTPLHVAASAGHSDILSLLIEHGADTNGRGRFGDTPLHRASGTGRLEAGQFLLNRGADIDVQNYLNNTALIYAAANGHVEFARMLLDRGALIDARGNVGRTPLHWAAENGQIGAVRLLLEHGADVNVRDESGDTPSRFASDLGHQEIVELLSVYGAN
jgi:Ankyrin repeats (3 copies)/Ankyrin repeats (many copies)